MNAHELPREDDTGGSLAPSDRHRVLMDERRREALAVIDDLELPVDLGVVAEAMGETDRSETPDTIALQLHHKHLPMMAELGIVDYDPESNRVEAHRISLDDLQG